MQKLLLLGDEAIAQGAIDAGLSGIYAYPGTPSTEITEYVERNQEAKELGVKYQWAVNEKTALEMAMGMSYAGKRAMACMKHVGLNVAADPFMNSTITGANGGLIIVVADDPSMHSSQNEQDSRYYGKFSLMPVFEPSSQQEAYDMVHYAYELSERFSIPVLFRITTRLAHSRAGVQRKEIREQNLLKLPGNLRQYVLLPSIARKQYKDLLAKQNDLEKESVHSGLNQYIDGNDKKLGIIACGLAYNYLVENFEDQKVPHPLLKISQYPIPTELVNRLYNDCDEILVLEDGYPIVEELLNGMLAKGKKIQGRLDGTVPRDGELNSNIVAKALNLNEKFGAEVPDIVVSRPPSFCPGCSHIDSYVALNEALSDYSKGRVMADIGCYTLAALPPFHSINSCVDMGASITMAKGLADAGEIPAVAVIGDSTFTHSGITGLLDAVNDKSPITVLILDNETTGMTGGQPSAGLGKIEQICKGIGVEEAHIRVLTPLKKYHEENVKAIKEELAYQGVSVVIPRRECIQTIGSKLKAKAALKAAEVKI
ncbi:MAG: indolepyruvate ferredoxin oxidoreductase [Bacteroidetes bacterium]|jgi:indolepyruvate ferredoxin oxidoreductase, alpha subunit|nr:indolepyruvate ferredoxin oxidoreductase [Bacteroidota bacterium]MBT5529444.1 indolepyruvate ferredoxin oxidoreductase [Cytophagia bacterium]MBT3423641.1 indolepyruvate ferredoxin oxidoreductase [Bacteroidota bacterium]MBT3932825.1 indolepyruvate ferredoxin oxidoreductase [Bacteroidota bacterium]MBT4340325.1 indolepyruvate ferredoxin oxidoreductase [Bacteroidota bacterium]